MSYLFLDIESYVDPEDESSGLNAFRPSTRIFGISYNYYSHNNLKIESIKSPTFLFDWKIGSEKELLQEFYLVLKKSAKEEHAKIVGFNHLSYDIPMLFFRMVYHNIAPKDELFGLLFVGPRHIDLAQIGMAFCEATKKSRDFRCVSQKNINSQFNIPIKENSGRDLSRFYDKKQFDKIETYCSEEFTFELLYLSLLEYFLMK